MGHSGVAMNKAKARLHSFPPHAHTKLSGASDLLERHPAAGWVGWVEWVPQSLQSVVNSLSIGLLKPGLVWSLCRGSSDAADVVQSKDNWAHQCRVFLSHDGHLLIPKSTEH